MRADETQDTVQWKRSLTASDVIFQKEVPVGGSEEQEAARRRRQRLIERLNAKEAELSGTRAERLQLSEKELEAEIEKERLRNFSRVGFPHIGPS